MADSIDQDTPDENSSSPGSPLLLILSHVFAYPGTYTSSFDAEDLANPNSRAHATARFTQAIMKEALSSPVPLGPLSSTLFTAFLRRCFAPNLPMVDFPQGIIALKYLHALEAGRRIEFDAAFGRLGLLPIDEAQDGFRSHQTKLMAWVRNMRSGARKAEALYSQLYVSLRKWILINEMSLPPFSRPRVENILNILYPGPELAEPPLTAKLTAAVLERQHKEVSRYITKVELVGVQALRPLMEYGKRPGEDNSWSVVREALDGYLRVTNEILQECDIVAGNKLPMGNYTKLRKHPPNLALSDRDKWDSTVDAPHAEEIQSPFLGIPKGLTTLERIARELLRLKASNDTSPRKPDWQIFPSGPEGQKDREALNDRKYDRPRPDQENLTEDVLGRGRQRQSDESSRSSGAKARRVLGLDEGKDETVRRLPPSEQSRRRSSSRSSRSNGSGQSLQGESFDKDEMLRQRLVYEAAQLKEQERRSPEGGMKSS